MKTVHIVPHQHFDLVWRRPSAWYKEKRAELYTQAFNLLTVAPEFTFSFCQALPLREFLEHNPEYEVRVQEWLATGRLEIIGGAESICDLNMCRGATIMRNIRQGRKYFAEHFNYPVKAGSFEDAFGVPEQLPGILKLSGYTFYKAGRMPRPGQKDICGDFIWTGRDKSEIRCVSSPENGSDWGWGYPDNPDAPQTSTAQERYRQIYSRLTQAADIEAGNILYMMTGEEHDIPDFLPDLVKAINEQVKDVEFRFSTFNAYYNSLPEDYWKTVPRYDGSTDLARLFTGCYTSRIYSKINARALESRLTALNIASALNNTAAVPQDDWDNLFIMQVHDGLCGCHIEENAAYLEKLFTRTMKKADHYELPWMPRLPNFRQTVTGSGEVSDGVHHFGKFAIEIIGKRLHNIVLDGQPYGMLCNLILREDSGTLWTEEYSGREHCCDQPETVAEYHQGHDLLKIVTCGKIDDFRGMWPGFSSLEYKKIYRIDSDNSAVQVEIELDWLGNSTEVALSWKSEAIGECLTEIPFGSCRRSPGRASGDTICGDAFPVLNWACTDRFAVFNRGTPGCAIRNGQLETIILRSPVKRWSPWFPVTPDLSCWDNGRRCFRFLWMPFAADCKASELHRLGVEFNLDAPSEKCGSTVLDDLPDNLIPADIELNGDALEVTVFEADGREVKWRNEVFTPFAIKRIFIQ